MQAIGIFVPLGRDLNTGSNAFLAVKPPVFTWMKLYER